MVTSEDSLARMSEALRQMFLLDKTSSTKCELKVK